MRAKIVLGLGWGDEGKGVTTDYLCSKSVTRNSINVRFSGGQQAGHNVVKGDISHIFASFGAGTLAGVGTYLTEHCTFYPPNIVNEYITLVGKGIKPYLSLHPLSMCTTPYDVAFNRWSEKLNNHGSCGIGVGATMKRNLQSPYKFYATDLIYHPLMYKRLDAVKEYYLEKIRELSNYGPMYQGAYKKALEEFAIIAKQEMVHFLSALDHIFIQNMVRNYILDYGFLRGYDQIIFEGSQGILLDMDRGIFPNVTYAHTTSRNAMGVCEKVGISRRDIEVYYVTRCYQTRHGNGWMSKNNPIELVGSDKETNTTNEYQGVFRVGELDYGLLRYALKCDSYSWECDKNLVVTCLDQRPDLEFDYSKLKEHTFHTICESRSPEANFLVK